LAACMTWSCQVSQRWMIAQVETVISQIWCHLSASATVKKLLDWWLTNVSGFRVSSSWLTGAKSQDTCDPLLALSHSLLVVIY
jgi:hypothetical protein